MITDQTTYPANQSLTLWNTQFTLNKCRLKINIKHTINMFILRMCQLIIDKFILPCRWKNFIPVFLHLDAKCTFTQLPHGKCLQKLNCYCFSLLTPQKQSKCQIPFNRRSKINEHWKGHNCDKLSMFDCLSTLEIENIYQKNSSYIFEEKNLHVFLHWLPLLHHYWKHHHLHDLREV